MKVLFIGGTGVISTAVSKLAVEKGIDLYLLNRGNNRDRVPEGAKVIVGDIRKPEEINDLLDGYRFDVVADFIGFVPQHVETDIRLFDGKVEQYIYVSSASAYQKSAQNYIITEETPLENPYWEYSRLKKACEERLWQAYRETGFPVTVVRPSLTYGNTNIGLVLGSWKCPYTTVARMLAGKKVIVPGDGTSLWTMTHNTDFAKGFVGLLGNKAAVGEAFHITSDEVLSWNKIFETLYKLLGVTPNVIHIPSEYIGRISADKLGTLLGDKSESAVFDNSKIKKFVPGYEATTSFEEGAKQYLAHVADHPELREVDTEWDAFLDSVIERYERAYEGL